MFNDILKVVEALAVIGHNVKPSTENKIENIDTIQPEPNSRPLNPKKVWRIKRIMSFEEDHLDPYEREVLQRKKSSNSCE